MGYADWNFIFKKAREAEDAGMFINIKNKWYSPDELMHGPVDKRMGPLVLKEEVLIRDPVPTIKKMRAYLDAQEAKLADFATKVSTYYQKRNRRT